ncbi:MAG TPA: tRNA (N6-threonylcarbamoyladenosine(37)-N6)-methyltransferase TrmO, partial [Anaerolineae bacterium]
RDTRWSDVESEIEIDPQWRGALAGLAEFSHIWVVTYLDRMPAASLGLAPKMRDGAPSVGIFATRGPQRPNPIGICAVELIQVFGGILRVRGLDALDGTPVLDLKPYLARRDAIKNTRVGAWAQEFGDCN